MLTHTHAEDHAGLFLNGGGDKFYSIADIRKLGQPTIQHKKLQHQSSYCCGGSQSGSFRSHGFHVMVVGCGVIDR